MNSDSQRSEGKAKCLHQKLFSLNIAFAITYALFAYDSTSYMAVHAGPVVRSGLEDFAHLLRRIAPLVVNHRTESEHLYSVIIRESVFALLVLGIALVLYLLVRLLDQTAAGELLLVRISAVTAFVAAPSCWLYIVRATWRGSQISSFWGRYGYFFIVEAAVTGGLIYLVRKQPIWRGAFLFALHYVFWVALVLYEPYWLAFVTLSIPLSLVFPFSGFSWLRYFQAHRMPTLSQTSGK